MSMVKILEADDLLMHDDNTNYYIYEVEATLNISNDLTDQDILDSGYAYTIQPIIKTGEIFILCV